MVYAGGLFNSANSKAYYYLAKNGKSSIVGTNWWWTMTPSSFDANSANSARMFGVNGPNLNRDYIYNEFVVRPVASLRKEVVVTGGDGSASNPYTVNLP